MSTATDVATQIASLASQIAALQSSASGRRGNSSTDTRLSFDVRQLRLANKRCERCDANPSHRWSDCQYRNFQSAPTLLGARRANANNFAAASGNA
ncbi:hypothetical protein E4U25_008334 [Claviceps purpurea]|nr:hypothetical protein E4U25_008334 [Claviceps purpurea]